MFTVKHYYLKKKSKKKKKKKKKILQKKETLHISAKRIFNSVICHCSHSNLFHKTKVARTLPPCVAVYVKRPAVMFH